MNDIAREVGLTAASLYYHFENKDFLLLSLLERPTRGAMKVMREIYESDRCPSERLALMIEQHARFITGAPALASAQVFELRSLLNVEAGFITRDGGKFREEFQQRRKEFFNSRQEYDSLFRRVIKEGIDSGQFRKVDATVLTAFILGAGNWTTVWFKEGGRLLERICRAHARRSGHARPSPRNRRRDARRTRAASVADA